MARKTHASLTSTALVTYEKKVQPELDGVTFFGGSAKEAAQYRYPNGSRLVIGGLDKPRKIMFERLHAHAIVGQDLLQVAQRHLDLTRQLQPVADAILPMLRDNFTTLMSGQTQLF